MKLREKNKEKIMARVELMPGIESISGRMGDMIFRTSKTTGKVYVSYQPRRKKGR